MVISPETVPARHYFLEFLQSPFCIWAIRILLVAVFIAVMVVYIKMKGKNEE